MARARRIVLALALVAVLLVIALVVAATRTYDSPELGRRVLAALSGDDLEVAADRVVLRPLRGVELEGAIFAGRLPDGRFDARVERVVLAHDLSKLLGGEVLVESIELRDGAASIVWDAEAAPVEQPSRPGRGAGGAASTPASDAATADDGGLGLTLRIERLAIDDVDLRMAEATPGGSENDIEMVRFEGFDLDLREIVVPPEGSFLAARAVGAVEADRMVTDVLVAEPVDGDLRLADGHLVFDELSLPTRFGPLGLRSLDLALDATPYTYTLEGGGSPIDANTLLGASSGFGPAQLAFAFSGDGSETGNLRGNGSLSLDAGTLGDLPTLAAIERLLANTELIGRPYEPFRIDFEVVGDRVDVAPFELRADALALAGGGALDLAGPLALRLELSLPRADVQVDEIPREVLDALTDVDGRVKLPLRIGGTIDAPTVGFDRSGWGEVAKRRLVDEASRAINRGLSRLFGSKDSDDSTDDGSQR